MIPETKDTKRGFETNLYFRDFNISEDFVQRQKKISKNNKIKIETGFCSYYGIHLSFSSATTICGIQVGRLCTAYTLKKINYSLRSDFRHNVCKTICSVGPI